MMKLRKINLLTAIACSAVMAFTACSKDDGPIPERISIEDVPAVTMNLEVAKANNRDTIRLASMASFSTKFKVSMFFPEQPAPTKVDIVVRKNGSAANVKLYKADIATFPTTFTVTPSDISNLFGAPLATGDTYDFGPDIYANGKKYEAFPNIPITGSTGTAVGNGSGVATGMNLIGFWEFVRIVIRP